MTPPAPARVWTAWGKRGADVVASAALLLLSTPLLALSAGAVLLSDGAPVLFRQQRVGLGGRRFPILKLRTMRAAPGPDITSAGDARVTRIGRRLRQTKVDELPQLWNVLRGDMSLVGPRPELPRYVAMAPRGFRAVTGLRPGMVDWASLIFRDEERVLADHAGEPEFYTRVLLPRKLALARLYQRHAGPGLDLRLLAATLATVLGADGIARAIVGAGLWDRRGGCSRREDQKRAVWVLRTGAPASDGEKSGTSRSRSARRSPSDQPCWAPSMSSSTTVLSPIGSVPFLARSTLGWSVGSAFSELKNSSS